MITIRDLALQIAKVMNASPMLEFTGNIRAGDPNRWLADISKLARIGFQPAYSLHAGLQAVRDWLLSTHNSDRFL